MYQYHNNIDYAFDRNINFLNELHSQLADYFLGIWGGGVKKPYELSDAQKYRFPLVEIYIGVYTVYTGTRGVGRQCIERPIT